MKTAKPLKTCMKNIDDLRAVDNERGLIDDERSWYVTILGFLMEKATKRQLDPCTIATISRTHVKDPQRVLMVETRSAMRYLNKTKVFQVVVSPGKEDQLAALADIK